MEHSSIVLPRHPSDEESDDWALLSLQGLGAAYGEQEPEYSLDAVKEPSGF
jgi:hypothetical protein